jgi:hypothetical protein
MRRLAPCGFVRLFVVAKSLFEATDHLGGGFEHGLEVGIVDLLDVLIARWVLEAAGRSSAIDTRHCDRPANSISD